MEKQFVDIDFGPDGSLYVLQHDANGLLAPGNAGSLIHVRHDGTRSTLGSGLVDPASVAISDLTVQPTPRIMDLRSHR